MLAPRHIFFTALEGALLDSTGASLAPAADALYELGRRRVSLVLSGAGTRAQIEPLRRKLEHGHPFITESGGGLFLPDGYFSQHLEDAMRVARYFCVPFGRPYGEAAAALLEIAAEAGAEVVGYSQMNVREIARNTNQSPKQAELDQQREFSERFFFAGAGESSIARFTEIAAREKWQLVPGEPFWQFFSGNDAGRALQYLMRLYRAGRTRVNSVAIGSTLRDLPLLAAADHAIILPRPGTGIDAELVRRVSRRAKVTQCEVPGAAGWNQAVLGVLSHD
jgi:mannosyl-3-phosphoglycerate phosphatase